MKFSQEKYSPAIDSFAECRIERIQRVGKVLSVPICVCACVCFIGGLWKFIFGVEKLLMECNSLIDLLGGVQSFDDSL